MSEFLFSRKSKSTLERSAAILSVCAFLPILPAILGVSGFVFCLFVPHIFPLALCVSGSCELGLKLAFPLSFAIATLSSSSIVPLIRFLTIQVAIDELFSTSSGSTSFAISTCVDHFL